MDFKILGPLEVLDGEQPIALGGTKQRALLAFLLLHANEVVSSDRLIDELWGEDGLEDGSKALQIAVSRLRRALDPGRPAGKAGGLLVTRPPGYELCLERDQLDLHRFEDELTSGRAALAAGNPAVAADKLAGALALWRGVPLADLAYESFAQAEVTRLEELRISALEDRIASDLELGRHADLVGELQALVQRHPLRERLRVALMLALYRAGRQAEALEVYRDTRRALVEELGIEPGAELKDLEQAILAQDPALAAPQTQQAQAAPDGRTTDTLVGRGTELGQLLSLLDGALSGAGHLVLIGGEPGIGKSHLAEALAAQARERGAVVLVGRCWEAGGAPSYWPWVQALRSYLRESDPEALRLHVGGRGAELATIVPELRGLVPELPAAPAPDSSNARFRLFDSVASFLKSAASTQPLVLLIDDLHAADAPTLLLLRFVAAELAAAPILIIGCYRDTDVGPGHVLAETLPELTRQTAVRRLPLKGLSHSDTSQLLELTTGQAPSEELSSRIHEETDGNPLFAGEVARLLAAEGLLEQAERSEARLPVPEGIKAAIAQRLHGQSEACRQVLTLASVLGREFDLEALAGLSSMDEDALLEALDEAATARLVGEVPGTQGRLRFSHVLMRDTIYDELAPGRRLRLHLEIAEALETLYAGNLEPHVTELAHHYIEAGGAGAEKAIGYSGRAGDRAAGQFAYEEAARHYSSALRLVDRAGSVDAGHRCELLLSLADALSRAGEGAEAKETFRHAAVVAESSGQPEQLARAALGYGGRFAWARAGSDTALVPLLERALAAVGEEDSPARVRLLARLAAAARDDPVRDRRRQLAGEAVQMARRIGDPVTLAHALDGYWPAVEGPDTLDSSEKATELISLAERIGDKERAYMGHDYRLHSFWARADRAGVDLEVEALTHLSEELRQPAQRWHITNTRAVVALMEGRLVQAEQLISEAALLGQRAQSWNAAVSHRIGLFVLRHAQGRLAELEDTIRRSAREYPALLRFRCALAHVYAELGRSDEAHAVFEELLSHDLAREYLDAEWLFSICLLPEACASLGDDELAARVYEILLPYEGLYAEAPVEGVFGSAARGLGVLATMLRHFDDAEGHFDTAVRMERRMGAHPWLAHAQHQLAAMLLARAGAGDAERAAALAAEALNTYRSLGMEAWAGRAAALR